MSHLNRVRLLLLVGLLGISSALSLLGVIVVDTKTVEAQSTWTFCANEGGTCVFTTPRFVRYGKNTTWTEPMRFNDTEPCTTARFGDPLPGVTKECQTLTPPLGLSWTEAGVAGPNCKQILEPSDPDTWSDNILCAGSNLGFVWSYNGQPALPNCVQWLEPADLAQGWGDNWLCTTADLGLRWSYSGRISGMLCTRIQETSDPQSWDDNFLCEPDPTSPPPPPPITVGTNPYFRTIGGGPFVGGWFNDNNDSNYCSTRYQSPFTVSPTNHYRGAIMGWANSNRARSAGSNLDAFAIGLIEGKSSSEYGFYSGLSGTGSLSFANNKGSLNVDDFWGGIFEGADLKAHCIADYFGTKQTNIVGGWDGSSFSQTGQRTWSGGQTPTTTNSIPAGNKLAVFVDGNVFIRGNIEYGSGSIENPAKFALIVKGNIYIAPGVTRLDGWYVAQPTAGTSGGEIWTCSNGSSTIDDRYIRSNCGSELDIRGALTAKQINLARIAGDLVEESAEDFDFIPEMVLGGSFFEDETSTPPTVGAIESLISLPPVF